MSVGHVMERHQSGVITSSSLTLGTGGGFILIPQSRLMVLPRSPVLDDMHTAWDSRKFLIPRSPILIDTLKDRSLFSTTHVASVTDMPIKFPNSPYHIPIELSQFSEAIQICISCEHEVNKYVDQYYAYLTIDQRPVKTGEYQRGKGLHSDSIQGRRIKPKTYIEHTYLCVDRDPTRFYPQPFDLSGHDVDKHWFNAVFEEQVNRDVFIQAGTHAVMLLDAYTIHGAVAASCDGVRTVFRLIYSVRIFDRLGNTHNALFKYDWEMQPRPVPADLVGLPKK